MKGLWALAVVQLGLMAFLAVKITTLERPTGSVETGNVPPATMGVSVGTQESHLETQPHLDALEANLRRIVREEMAAVVYDGRTLAKRDAMSPDTERVAPLPDPQRLADVSSQLDYFISIGSISPPEMAVLQAGIAQLDEAGRRQMMGKLLRAINAGGLQGEL